jgi:hypothetical protein
MLPPMATPFKLAAVGKLTPCGTSGGVTIGLVGIPLTLALVGRPVLRPVSGSPVLMALAAAIPAAAAGRIKGNPTTLGLTPPIKLRRR